MAENIRNSMKLDIAAVRLSDVEHVGPKETYKPIPEYPVDSSASAAATGAEVPFDGAAVKNSNMVRESNDHIEDGAGDAMLGEKEQLALAGNEVKFISAEHKNGDAKIDIGNLEKAFTGMTKEELMRYANDPFWVRLRWIFFILFWGLWIAMLIGAILIIIGSPKCAAPVPLPWYKQGPIVRLRGDGLPSEAQLNQLKEAGARGAIFEIPADDTYLIGGDETVANRRAAVEERIKSIVAALKAHNIRAIADVTPNFVSGTDALFVAATATTAADDATTADARTAFIIADHQVVPNNWLSKVNGSAWTKLPLEGQQSFALSQFGANRYDLQLNSTLAKRKLTAVLHELTATLGVHGVRLHNAKHFIVSPNLRDEVPAGPTAAPDAGHTEYGYWLHTHSTYLPGLGDLIADLAAIVKNGTAGEGFLTLADNVGRPEAFRTTADGRLAVELPIVGVLPHTLATAPTAATAKQLYQEVTRVIQTIGTNGSDRAWVQWEYDAEELAKNQVNTSEYNGFVMLLPGVPVAYAEHLTPVSAASSTIDVTSETTTTTSATATSSTNVTATTTTAAAGPSFVEELEALRLTPSYMHGSFDVYTDANETVIAYTRIKSGNPGYFVAYNPTESLVTANFSSVAGIPDLLTVHLFSDNYRVKDVTEKGKVPSAAIPISGRSVLILTYVPKSAE